MQKNKKKEIYFWFSWLVFFINLKIYLIIHHER